MTTHLRLYSAPGYRIAWLYAVFIAQSPSWCHKRQRKKSNSWFEGVELLTDDEGCVTLDLSLALSSSHTSSTNSTMPDPSRSPEL